jgi:HEAT repeat protein
MNLYLFESAMEINDIGKAKKLLTEMSAEPNYDAVPVLIKHITETENPEMRDALAIALRDIGSEEAVAPLIDLINDPKTIGNRGTLLYALEPFDCTEHLEAIVHQFLTGNFEVQAEAYQRIEAMNRKVPPETLLKSMKQVKEQLNEMERQQELHRDVLEFLFEKHVKE